jgi:hypothetical protein
MIEARGGKPLTDPDCERWLRLNRLVYKIDKVDVFSCSCDLNRFERLSHAAEALDLRLSLRTACVAPPPRVESLRHAGPLDVYLTPWSVDEPHFAAWLDTCRDAGLPTRVQLVAPFELDFDPEPLVRHWADAGTVVLNVAAHDPLINDKSARNDLHTKASVDRMVALARAGVEAGLETTLIGLPFCLVPEDLLAHVANSKQFYLDHQQYERMSHRFALRACRIGPARVAQAIAIELGTHTSYKNPIDAKLLPWILEYPWVRARVWALHKLLRFRHGPIEPLNDRPRHLDEAVAKYVQAQCDALGPVCSECRYRRICDGVPKTLDHALPGLQVVARAGDLVVDPMSFARRQSKHYDVIDAVRFDTRNNHDDWAIDVRKYVETEPPTREIDSMDYRVDGEWSWPLPGSLRWFSFTSTEKVSTPLATLEPPFTLSFTVGGGLAEYVGFSFGRHCKIVCPMTAYSHRIVLRVEADGRYLLLRDGQPVEPVEFTGVHYVPTQLGRPLEPRISIWNIDGTVGTQAVYVWEGEPLAHEPPKDILYSIVIVSTRYARRLAATLENLAHQQGVSHNEIEVLVAFVPGIDATPDLLDSFEAIYPDLCISRVAFAEEDVQAKGFMLNECIGKATGEWTVLLDADTLIHPDMLRTLGEQPDRVKFVAPDGRKMLSQATTAEVLLGRLQPWSDWQTLINSDGEYRAKEADGVPVGFCQCFRTVCRDHVRYEEMRHFEGADWKFAKDLIERYGHETRLSGLPVCHLDHGASNWYGTQRHY